jgi:hypothetical protein
VVVAAKWFERVLAKVALPFYVIILVLIISLLKLLLEVYARGLCCISAPRDLSQTLSPSSSSCIVSTSLKLCAVYWRVSIYCPVRRSLHETSNWKALCGKRIFPQKYFFVLFVITLWFRLKVEAYNAPADMRYALVFFCQYAYRRLPT